MNSGEKCAKVQTQNKYDERESEKHVIQHREKKEKQITLMIGTQGII